MKKNIAKQFEPIAVNEGELKAEKVKFESKYYLILTLNLNYCIYRTFLTKDDYITHVYNYSTKEESWSKASLETITAYKHFEYVTKDAKPEELVKKWLGMDKGGFVLNVFALQQRKKDKESWKRREKIKKKDDYVMKMFKKPPKNLNSFVDEKVFRNCNHIFFNRKLKTAYCTSCKREVEVDLKTIKNNHSTVCPYCKAIVMANTDTYSRKVYYGTAVTVSKHGKYLLIRYFDTSKNYKEDFKNPKISIFECVRSIMDIETGKTTYYEYKSTPFSFERRWRKCNEYASWYGSYSSVQYRAKKEFAIYNLNTIKCIKYVDDCFLDFMKQYEGSAWGLENFLKKYMNNDIFEKLVKVGFYELAENVNYLLATAIILLNT